MKSFALLSALAAAEIASAPPETRGPYRDESARIWAELPSPREYPSFAAWDAEFAQEVFTARDGRRCQLDREMTPAELAENLALRQFVGALRAPPGSGSHLRATVTTHNPVDEEYRALYPSSAALELAIRAEHGSADLDMMHAWSADPTPGGEGDILEHELGHTYTLKHCSDPNCTMQSVLDAGALGNFHDYAESCSGQDHFRKMGNQRNRY